MLVGCRACQEFRVCERQDVQRRATWHRHASQPSSLRNSIAPDVSCLAHRCRAPSDVEIFTPPRSVRPASRMGPVGARQATDAASRAGDHPPFKACRRQFPGGTGRSSWRSLPSRWPPSSLYRRAGFRITRLESWSASTHVAARMAAESSRVTPCLRCAVDGFARSSAPPTATGRSDSCRSGFAHKSRTGRRFQRRAILSIQGSRIVGGTQ